MKNVLKLSQPQLDRISEIFGNIAVVWFSAGIISPVFSPPQVMFDFAYRFLVSLGMSGFFFVWSVRLMRGVKK